MINYFKYIRIIVKNHVYTNTSQAHYRSIWFLLHFYLKALNSTMLFFKTPNAYIKLKSQKTKSFTTGEILYSKLINKNN